MRKGLFWIYLSYDAVDSVEPLWQQEFRCARANTCW